MSARLPTRLAKDETTTVLAVTAGSSGVTLDLKGNPLPQPYTAFGFRAYTTYLRQTVKLKWSLQCFRGKKSVARSGVVRGHQFVIVWKAPTMPRADYCFVDADGPTSVWKRRQIDRYLSAGDSGLASLVCAECGRALVRPAKRSTSRRARQRLCQWCGSSRALARSTPMKSLNGPAGQPPPMSWMIPFVDYGVVRTTDRQKPLSAIHRC